MSITSKRRAINSIRSKLFNHYLKYFPTSYLKNWGGANETEHGAIKGKRNTISFVWKKSKNFILGGCEVGPPKFDSFLSPKLKRGKRKFLKGNQEQTKSNRLHSLKKIFARIGGLTSQSCVFVFRLIFPSNFSKLSSPINPSKYAWNLKIMKLNGVSFWSSGK